MKDQRDLTPFQVAELEKKVKKEQQERNLAYEYGDCTDGTRIGNFIWGSLKEKAMHDDYDVELWYKELKPEDQKLVVGLRLAQKYQGNMEPLN